MTSMVNRSNEINVVSSNLTKCNECFGMALHFVTSKL